ncbi:MAG TPA: CYCXC family (seleno)protein [Candidatus Acidoferrales bacterium]|nr:CYCXC family (seleno)protein [Candidatus Acidoferrales bacterium]
MLKGIKGALTLAAGAVALAAVSYAGYVSINGDRNAAAGQVASSAARDPGEQLRITLDPKGFQGNVREAYEVAERDPALLAQLHCYCGCDKADGHKNLLDCFRDSHGSTCAICVGEARDASAMAARGVTIEQIRDALRARYAHGS